MAKRKAARKKGRAKRRPAKKRKAPAKKRPARKALAKRRSRVARRRAGILKAARSFGKAAKRAAKGAEKRAKGARKAVAKAAAKTVNAVAKGAPVVTIRSTRRVKDVKERAFEKGPGFHLRTDYRPSNVIETGLQFVGHEIADDDTTFNQFLHYDQLYTIRHGQNSKFFRNLLKGKLVGTKCPKCGDAWVPPRTNCWNLDCNLKETDWVEFPLRATVHTWTIAGWSGRSSLKRLPIVLVYARIEGSTVAIANEVHGIDPWDVEFDMPLEVKFIPEKERTGSVTDFYFVPAKGWKPGPMTPEKERIKKLVEPVYEWVKTLK